MRTSWTPEQRRILALAGPRNATGPGRIVRTSSGAGTGKTSTIEGVAAEHVLKGHESISYIVFNRQAASEAKDRFGRSPSLLGKVRASTLHSAVFQAMRPASEGSESALTDQELELRIRDIVGRDVDEALAGVDVGQRQKTRALLFLYVRKTLDLFLCSSKTEEAGLDPARASINTFFPATLFHASVTRLPHGLDRDLARKGWYVKLAKRVWGRMVAGDFFTFDSVVKQAQLAGAALPGTPTCVLVDESQDLTECQVSLLYTQALARGGRPGADLYLFMDAAQTIYGFRGARAENVLRLGGVPCAYEPEFVRAARVPDVIDRSLTVSWRFGPAIAAAANVALLSKALSPQTTEAKNPWIPYLITGGAGVPGQVVSASLVAARAWQRPAVRQVTLIARANATLLEPALVALYGTPPGEEPPRIVLLGDGPGAGKKLWRRIIAEVDKFVAVRSGEATHLQLEPWMGEAAEAERRNEPPRALEWQDVVDDVHSRELSNYKPLVTLVERFGDELKRMLDRFQRDVVGSSVRAQDAHLILTSAHQAKGLEWDHVEVCPDFEPLCRWRVEGAPRAKGDLDWPKHGDHLNMWHVALTRARRTLAVPPSLALWARDMDKIRDFIEGTPTPAPPPAPPTHGGDAGANDDGPRTPTKRARTEPPHLSATRVNTTAAAPLRQQAPRHLHLHVAGGQRIGAPRAVTPPVLPPQQREAAALAERRVPPGTPQDFAPRARRAGSSNLGTTVDAQDGGGGTKQADSANDDSERRELVLGEGKFQRLFSERECTVLYDDVYVQWRSAQRIHGALAIHDNILDYDLD